MVRNQPTKGFFFFSFFFAFSDAWPAAHRCSLGLVESFDDSNTERLRAAMASNDGQDKRSRGYEDFGFDPKCIDWDDYFYRVHIPGVVKYLCD